MRIAIDQSAGFNQGAGIGRYARNLVPELVQAMPDADVTLWYAPDNGARFAEQATATLRNDSRIRLRHTNLSRRRMDQLWFRLRAPLPIERWTGLQDLIYSPDFTAPPSIRRTPKIVTVHDLAFEIVPERAPHGLREYLSAVVPRAVQDAAAVAVVSETTKRDLIERMRVDEARITVVPNAADQRFFTAAPLTPDQRKAIGLPERYLLTVGTIEPRKNHLTLFHALDALSAAAKAPLVVVGRVGWAAEEIMAEARNQQAKGAVILLDYLADDLLPGLYAGAAGLIYPSWYEGFGLPVLEGLAAGIPVIASDAPAHREVGGETVEYCPPGSAEAFAAAIERVVASDGNDEARAVRRTRAGRYSWQASGRQLAALINEVSAR